MTARALAAATALALLAGCAQMPSGPNIRVMPAPYKPFELFTADDAVCRDWAANRVDPDAVQAADQTAGSVVAGTAAGAAAGGLIGGTSRSAATGAGVGLIAGTIAGAQAAEWNSWSLQRRYDWAYGQCMYAKGNQVPGFAPIRVPPPPPPPAPPPIKP